MPGPYFPDPAAEALRDTAFDASGFSANIDGNVLEMLKYIAAATAGEGRMSIKDIFRSDPLYDSAALGNPFLLAQVSPAGAVSFKGAGATATAVAQVTHTLDAAAGLTYYSSNGVGTPHTIRQSIPPWVPYGSAGVLPTFQNPEEFRLPTTSLTRKFVMEWYGRITSVVEGLGDSSGFGLSNNTAQIAGTNSIAVSRQSTNKWALSYVSAGGGTSTAEVTGTADDNDHLFRLEWYKTGGGTKTADLYVDNVLKVTAASSSVPDIAISSPIANVWLLYSGSGNTTADSLRFYAALCYWKA